MNQGPLIDKQIVEYLLKKEIVSSGLPDPYSGFTNNRGEWYLPSSPVQPSSLDLHVGKIFIPQSKPGELGSSKKPKKSHSLDVGHTAIVTTKEILKIPNDIVAFGFPPDGISQNGILMVNLGHIDPGWYGQIKFVLINVGKEPYALKADDMVATLLFFKSSEPVHKNYLIRKSITSTPILPNVETMIQTLSKDFLDVDYRTKKIIKVENNRTLLINGIIGVVFVILVGFVNYFVTNSSETSRINDIQREISIMKNDIEFQELGKELDSLKKIISVME